MVKVTHQSVDSDLRGYGNIKTGLEKLNELESSLAEKANQSDVTNKVDKVTGKGLSTNDYDNTEKAEVAKVKNKADQSFAASIQTQVNNLVVGSGSANVEVSQAHADSTGNTFPTIHTRLSNIEGMVFNRTFNFTPSWEVGSLLSADGSKTTDLNRIRSVDFLTYTVGSTITIAPASGYQFVRRYFDASGNYVSGDGGYITASTTFALTYPKMKIVLARVDSANMNTLEGSNLTVTTDITNAETKDARTDLNGSKYTSIGENIRNSINGILTGWQKVIYNDWELGSIDVAGGNVTQNNRLRTNTFHSYPIGQRIKISVPTGYKFLRRYFDANNVYVTGDSAYITVDTEFNLAYPKFKLVMAKTDDSNITVDLSSNITIIIKNFLYNRWVGKTWLTIGDSITARGWYQTKVIEDLGLTNFNYGIGGTTIAQKDDADSTQAFCLRYTNMQATADIVTVWGGVNDFGQSIPLGTKGSTDKKTFYGALKVLIEGLLTKYPGKKLAFIATTPVNTTNASLEYIFGANGQGLTLKSYVDVLIEMCEEYSVPVLDLFRTSGFNQLNMTIMTSNVGQTAPDGLHPSMAGYEFIRPKLVNFINNI